MIHHFPASVSGGGGGKKGQRDRKAGARKVIVVGMEGRTEREGRRVKMEVRGVETEKGEPSVKGNERQRRKSAEKRSRRNGRKREKHGASRKKELTRHRPLSHDILYGSFRSVSPLLFGRETGESEVKGQLLGRSFSPPTSRNPPSSLLFSSTCFC